MVKYLVKNTVIPTTIEEFGKTILMFVHITQPYMLDKDKNVLYSSQTGKECPILNNSNIVENRKAVCSVSL